MRAASTRACSATFGRSPGVAVAAPLQETRVNVSGPRGRRALLLIGADRSLARLEGEITKRYRAVQLPSMRFLALPGPVARDIGVPIGGSLTIELGAKRQPARLSTTLEASDIGSLAESPVAIVPLPFAQSLVGDDDGLARILVKPEPGQEAAVERALERIANDSIDVRPADFDVSLFEQAAQPTNQSTALFATISAFVGFLFAFNAMLLTLADRRRMVNALQYDGYSPWAVLQILLFDALALGLAASLIGLALGDQLSRHLFDATPGYLSFAFAVGEQRIVEWQSVAVALMAGVGASLLASLLPLGDLMRRPGTASAPRRRTADLHRWMLGAGLACLVGALGVVVLVPSAAVVGIGLLVAALMLLLPSAISSVLRLAELTLGRLRSAVPLISIGELRSMPARSIALAATGALAVFGTRRDPGIARRPAARARSVRSRRQRAGGRVGRARRPAEHARNHAVHRRTGRRPARAARGQAGRPVLLQLPRTSTGGGSGSSPNRALRAHPSRPASSRPAARAPSTSGCEKAAGP